MFRTGKSVQGNTELTLLAPLKQGLVDVVPTMTYAARLQLLLGTFFEDRKREIEKYRIAEGLLEELQVIHSVRWTLLNEERDLLLSVSFDGPWETYIRTIVDRAGALLDVIFTHCEGYVGNSCAEGYGGFSRWVRERQIPSMFLFGAAPTLTVDDVRYLQMLERTYAESPTLPFGTLVSTFALPPIRRQPSEVQRLPDRVRVLAMLRELFQEVGRNLTDRQLFDRCAELILRPDLKLPDSTVQPILEQGDPALWKWFDSLRNPPALDPAFSRQSLPKQITVEQRSSVQAGILKPLTWSGHATSTHGALALLQVPPTPEAWQNFVKQALASVSWEGTERDELHRAAGRGVPADPAKLVHMTLGLTYAAFENHGFAKEVREAFPQEFQEGMQQRSGTLGDVGHNHPELWSWPRKNWPTDASTDHAVPLSSVDVVLFVQTREVREDGEATDDEAATLSPCIQAWLQRFEQLSGARILHVQPTRRFPSQEGGHFKATDGISQPAPRGEGALPRDEVPLGDLLLGYSNSFRDDVPLLPEQLLRNSTFMGIRKMSQDVAAYDAISPEHRDKALGRRPDGQSLIKETKDNDFDYRGDSKGARCPFFAHVRRANPREEGTPRILRRGMSYGPRIAYDAGAERGVMFLGIAADLAQQFEVVLRWINGGNSTGVLSAHPDVIAGTWSDKSPRSLTFQGAKGVEHLQLPKSPLSILRWGLYCFLPSREALEALHTPEKLAPTSATVASDEPAAAAASSASWLGAPPLTQKAAAMKGVLESGGERARKYWDGVSKAEGVEQNEYALLVTKLDQVLAVLADPGQRFSARGYWERMKAVGLPLFLGMDPQPAGELQAEQKDGRYSEESRTVNQFASSISFEQSFAVARDAGFAWFKMGPSERHYSLDELARVVIAQVATSLFDLPSDLLMAQSQLARGKAPEKAQLNCPMHLALVFQHIFLPRPSFTQAAVAKGSSDALKMAVKERFADLRGSRFVKALQDTKPGQSDPDWVQSTFIGTLGGFAGPTYASMKSLFQALLRHGKLWHLPAPPQGAEDEKSYLAALRRTVEAALIEQPAPELLHRTAVEAAKVSTKTVTPGDIVAVNLGTAAREAREAGCPAPWRVLFGDTPHADSKRPHHACPGQEMAMGVLVGALAALLAQPGLLEHPSEPLTLWRAAAR